MKVHIALMSLTGMVVDTKVLDKQERVPVVVCRDNQAYVMTSGPEEHDGFIHAIYVPATTASW
jgi:hypothetical protein